LDAERIFALANTSAGDVQILLKSCDGDTFRQPYRVAGAQYVEELSDAF
jgi:hypothetical protein